MTKMEMADLFTLDSSYRNKKTSIADEKIITMNELRDRCMDFERYCREGFPREVYHWGTAFYTLEDKNAKR